MDFDLQKTIDILTRTPEVLSAMLSGADSDWLNGSEGEGSWSPKEILAHLILGEKTDWLPRIKLILSDKTDKTFEPFDMEWHLSYAAQNDSEALLEEFSKLRNRNISELKSLELNEKLLAAKGIHPSLGEATVKELLGTWTVHDLGHISQIARVMAKQYNDQVGPWIAFAGILKK